MKPKHPTLRTKVEREALSQWCKKCGCALSDKGSFCALCGYILLKGKVERVLKRIERDENLALAKWEQSVEAVYRGELLAYERCIKMLRRALK